MKVDNAIILAAGMCTRFKPLSFVYPKALLRVKGEVLIERQIRQLKEAGINNIYIVVGYMADRFSYLKDKYGVTLLLNKEYESRNNHSSIYVAKEYIRNSYICVSDNYYTKNPFSANEAESYYTVSYAKGPTDEWCVSTDDNGYISSVTVGGHDSFFMYGHAFWDENFSSNFLKILDKVYAEPETKNKYWEDIFVDNIGLLEMKTKILNEDSVLEFDRLEDLLEFDPNAVRINSVKPGMTNATYLYEINNDSYIIRIPDSVSNTLTNRKQEAIIYKEMSKLNISDELLYIDADTGIKITKYIENARLCNPSSKSDISLCMNYLKKVHAINIPSVEYVDLFKMISYYESLLGKNTIEYADYNEVKKNVFSLESFVSATRKEICLTHIDAVADNFLICKDEKNGSTLKLIDWEYAGLQDPDVDVAMFCLYSLFDRKKIDDTIDIYFDNACTTSDRMKIYAYIAIGGLLWSNWCKYKKLHGITFGEYAYRQYDYARTYSKTVLEYLKLI